MEIDNPTLELEMAIDVLTKGLDLMTQLCFDCKDGSEVVRELCGGVKRALEAGLSYLKSIDKPTGRQASENSVPQKNQGRGNGFKRLRSEDLNLREKTKRNELNLKKIITDSPFSDGYQWRKYGQKIIRNTRHPRCYYRCSYKGCSAQKQVQQNSNGKLPEYEVTFRNEHTCNASRVPISIPQLIVPSPDMGFKLISFDSNPRMTDNCTSSINVDLPNAAVPDNLSIGPIYSAPPSPAGQFYGTDPSAYYDDDYYFMNL